MDGEKRRAVEKQIHEGGKAGKRPALTGRSVFLNMWIPFIKFLLDSEVL